MHWRKNDPVNLVEFGNTHSNKQLHPGERPLRILAGQYFDSETGLYYNGRRYYDPKIGRYISSDPIGLAGGLNIYLYVGANPLRYTAIGGRLQYYDTYQEGEKAKNAIEKTQDVVKKFNEKTMERQQMYDKLNLFPPKSTAPNCPNEQSK